jgi:putative mRNA 3-end processing factor
VLKNKSFIDNADWLTTAVSRATFVETQADRTDALRSPSVIITTAGMLNGGPVIDYIKKLNQHSGIFISGFQVEGTNGRTLLDKGTVSVDGKERKVHVKASHHDLSAHAGKNELYDYVKDCGARTVICVHGDNDASISLAEGLKLEGYEAYAPKVGETIKLD